MNRKLIYCLLAVAAITATSSLSWAEETKPKGAKGISGMVEAVDATAMTITLKTGKKDAAVSKTINVAEGTPITVDGAKDKSLADIKEGMRAKVTPGDTEDSAAAVVATSGKGGKKPGKTDEEKADKEQTEESPAE